MTGAPPSELLIIGAAEIRRLLPVVDCIDLMERTMATVSQGGAELPLRTVMPIPESPNLFGSMPGYLADPPALGVKLISLYPENPRRGLSSHTGLVLLFDPFNGRPRTILDAATITAIRTAAATAAATRALASPDAGDLAILGTGEQAAMHLETMALIRPLRRVRVWGRCRARAEEFAATHAAYRVEVCDDVPSAVADADLVCTTTGAREPILQGAWIAPGAHVNLVGASVQAATEVDVTMIARSRVFVDHLPSARAQAGELQRAVDSGAVGWDHVVGEVGELFLGRVEGRSSADQITLYRSLGIAAQDLAAATFICERARAQGLGTRATL